MEQLEIRKVLQSAYCGTRKIKVVLKEGAAKIGPVSLLGMAKMQVLVLDTDTESNLKKVAGAGSWIRDSDRTVKMTLADNFNEGWFISRIGPHLDSIESVN